MIDQKSKRERWLINAHVTLKVVSTIVGMSLLCIMLRREAIKRKSGSEGSNKERTHGFIKALRSKIPKDTTNVMRKMTIELKHWFSTFHVLWLFPEDSQHPWSLV